MDDGNWNEPKRRRGKTRDQTRAGSEEPPARSEPDQPGPAPVEDFSQCWNDDGSIRKPDPPYPVGYGRPPLHSRFQKGQSGNPGGRPKGAIEDGYAVRSFKDLLVAHLNAPVQLSVNGQAQTLTTMEGVLKSMIVLATKDVRAAKVLIDLVEKNGVSFGSRPMTETELINSTPPEEILAAIEAVKAFHKYVEGLEASWQAEVGADPPVSPTNKIDLSSDGSE